MFTVTADLQKLSSGTDAKLAEVSKNLAALSDLLKHVRDQDHVIFVVLLCWYNDVDIWGSLHRVCRSVSCICPVLTLILIACTTDHPLFGLYQ